MTPAKLVASLPKTVMVGYRPYSIEAWPSQLATAAERYGECDRMNGIIRLRVDTPIQTTANTLLHEVMHACYENGAVGTADEEKTVTILTNQLCQVIRDNPDLLDWLKKALK